MKRLLDPDSLRALARGCAVLGAGGGGDPYLGLLQALQAAEDFGPVPLADLDELPGDGLIMPCGAIGAPTVSVEKIENGDEGGRLRHYLEGATGRTVSALMCSEIGGANGLLPVCWAAQMGLPVLDGDGMGRAFPELQMDTFSIYGLRCTPAGLADVRHNTVVFADLADTVTLERYARAVTIQMGGHAGYAFPLMTGAEAKRTAVPHTLTLARAIGAAVEGARRAHADPVAAVQAVTGGEVLFGGKVTDVERRMAAGFARGSLRLDGLGDWRGATMAIDFQNENLIARRDGAVAAVVPDLICIVDAATAAPVTTEVIRYGLRVVVLGIPAPPLLKTPEALAVVGPRAFGYDVEYAPLPGRYGGRSDED